VIAFILGRPLKGPGVTAASAMRAVEAVHGGLEIVDSRHLDDRSTFADLVADNGSSAFHITGPISLAPQGLDLSLEACLLEVDGRVTDSGTGASVHGHPGEALALVANALASRGLGLEEGWLVLAGGLTAAVAIEPSSRIAVHFTHLGSVVVSGG